MSIEGGTVFVIGTAGHVDHGKSTLIESLTGIDPDRLKEEKEREMTTDLGFAWLTLPSGMEVSIVDVPGHERFIKNMLAGVSGFDLALLIIAADEGVRPQTREHLAILDLLEVNDAIVVITKSDLVDSDWIELVEVEIEELLEDTRLAGSKIVSVSAVTGDGLDNLRATLDKRLGSTEPRKDLGRPRLAVDRSFTITGFGTVVTGTLTDGCLHTGQEIQIVPSQKRARIRGLQTHHQQLQEARPGSRVAVNLSGISHEQIQRGQVLTTPGWLRTTPALDVILTMSKDSPQVLRHNSTVSFHCGTTETLAKVRLLEDDVIKAGDSAWVQLRLYDSLPVVKDDFFIVRSSEATLGGGRIVDPLAKRHKRNHRPTLERLEIIGRGSEEEVLLRTLEELAPIDYQALVNRVHLPEGDCRRALENLLEQNLALIIGGQELVNGTLLYSFSRWSNLQQTVRATLDQHHSQFPLRKGMPKEEFRNRLHLPSHFFTQVLHRLVQESNLAEENVVVRLPDHKARISAKQQALVDDYLTSLEEGHYSPPTHAKIDSDLLGLLVDEGKVVKVSEEVVFSYKAYNEMLDHIVEHTRIQGAVNVAQVRDLFGTSRKYALALMEYLDQQRVTRRIGDERVLR